jgi:hypothetical protein
MELFWRFVIFLDVGLESTWQQRGIMKLKGVIPCCQGFTFEKTKELQMISA